MNATARALAQAERTLAALAAVADASDSRVPPDVAAQAGVLLEARDRLLDTIRSAAALDPTMTKIRIHGDYRLGQVLVTEGDVYIQNIEGHLAWPAAAQREKQPLLKDIAGMVRSFSYAAHAALLTHSHHGTRSPGPLVRVGAGVAALDDGGVSALGTTPRPRRHRRCHRIRPGATRCSASTSWTVRCASSMAN